LLQAPGSLHLTWEADSVSEQSSDYLLHSQATLKTLSSRRTGDPSSRKNTSWQQNSRSGQQKFDSGSWTKDSSNKKLHPSSLLEISGSPLLTSGIKNKFGQLALDLRFW